MSAPGLSQNLRIYLILIEVLRIELILSVLSPHHVPPNIQPAGTISLSSTLPCSSLLQ